MNSWDGKHDQLLSAGYTKYPEAFMDLTEFLAPSGFIRCVGPGTSHKRPHGKAAVRIVGIAMIIRNHYHAGNT